MLGLLMIERDQCLALALRQPGYCRAPGWQDIRQEAITPYLLLGNPRQRLLQHQAALLENRIRLPRWQIPPTLQRQAALPSSARAALNRAGYAC